MFFPFSLPPALAAEPPPVCDVLAKIEDADRELASISLAVGATDVPYRETRANISQTFKDPEKQIALDLLNLDTCTTRVVVITKHGDQLIAPRGYTIEPVTRVNGIRWNNWATDYRVIAPAGWFVIDNKYPLVKEVTVKVKKKTVTTRTVTPVYYTSFTDQLSVPHVIDAGNRYLASLSAQVDTSLRASRVMSLAYPGVLVVDVPVLKNVYVERKLPIEHIDDTEFLMDPDWAINRFEVLLGANQDRMSTFTCSTAAACGPMQFIASTWSMIDAAYPKAPLAHDFLTGARDSFDSLMAARLLDDYNLAIFRRALTAGQFQKLVENPALTEEVLASSYNTGATRTLRVLRTYFANPQRYPDWAQAKGAASNAHLLAQTKGYIAKLRSVRQVQ